MDLDSIVENVSWATVRCDAMLDPSGRDVAVVVAKLAFRVSPEGRATIAFRPVRFGESADGHGAVKFPAELVDQRPGTDVGLVGHAHPQRGKPVLQSMAWVQVGGSRKVINVFGPRRFTADFKGAVVPGPSQLIEEPVPLRFDHCFGGVDHSGDAHAHAGHHHHHGENGWASEPFNPAGRGFLAHTDPKTLIGKPAWVLEPVNDNRAAPSKPGQLAPIAHRSHGCFAPIPEHFEPRRKLAGTYDAEWAKKRAPVRPKDFDVAHNSWAQPELRFASPLTTDAPIEVAGVIPEGVWRFKLPAYGMEFESTTFGERVTHASHLDTFLIDADDRVVELVFRASIPLPRKWAMLERIVARGLGRLPDEILTSDASNETDLHARRSAGTAAHG
ncbi:MAG: DUF2169 domain-containing protein [Polyangiaceae bacterium]